ncbi:MAG: electron transport complex subunit RsxE [Acidobacteria bacterium]|nr:electron transport complex subunit RsxE [Acidobacteriota bacterium]
MSQPQDNPLLNGLWKENPTFVQVLGMCPTLAVTNSVRNALAMGLATTFVLVCSNGLISMIRHQVPKQVRIATYIAIAATAVTVTDYVVKAISIDIYKALGPFLALIVVNCIILARAEAFAAKNSVGRSLMDGLGNGLGFTLGLTLLGTVREVLGAGSFLGLSLFGPHFEPWVLFLLPPGGFITLAAWLLIFAWYKERKTKPAPSAQDLLDARS